MLILYFVVGVTSLVMSLISHFTSSEALEVLQEEQSSAFGTACDRKMPKSAEFCIKHLGNSLGPFLIPKLFFHMLQFTRQAKAFSSNHSVHRSEPQTDGSWNKPFLLYCALFAAMKFRNQILSQLLNFCGFLGLLSSFVEVESIKRHFKSRLVGTVLNGYLCLRKLVVQRTKLIDETQDMLLEMLEDMTTGKTTSVP